MTDGTGDPARVNEPAVHTHLGILQGIISRLASNSASAKAWTVGLVSGLLVIAGSRQDPYLVLLALIPNVWLGALDAYYLALEKQTRSQYNNFVRKVQDRTLEPSDLFAVNGERPKFSTVIEAAKSYSVWGFYGFLVLATTVIFVVLLLG